MLSNETLTIEISNDYLNEREINQLELLLIQNREQNKPSGHSESRGLNQSLKSPGQLPSSIPQKPHKLKSSLPFCSSFMLDNLPYFSNSKKASPKAVSSQKKKTPNNSIGTLISTGTEPQKVLEPQTATYQSASISQLLGLKRRNKKIILSNIK